MAAWAGFSDEDLRKLKRQTGEHEELGELSQTTRLSQKVTVNRKTANLSGRGRHMQSRKMPSTLSKPLEFQNKDNASVDPQQSLSLATQEQSGLGKQQNVKGKEISSASEVNGVKSHDENEVTLKKDASEELLDEKEGISRELSNLEVFQQKQKMIEEANKKKRQMLADTIKERQKKAKAETHKLTYIQKELNQLDHLVSIDVSVIRDRIEEASREYNEAQKKYDRLEKEFIATKIDMHKKQEAKENLTEHLCTVIHQNEMRKAKKLAELTKKLEMEIMLEDNELNVDLSAIPAMAVICPYSSSPTHKSVAPHFDNQVKTADGVKPKGDDEVANKDINQVKDSSDNINNNTSDLKVDIKQSAAENVPAEVVKQTDVAITADNVATPITNSEQVNNENSKSTSEHTNEKTS